MNRVLALAVLGGAILLAGCGHRRHALQAPGEEVEAEGWAVNDLRDPIGSRQRALADAQRRAVEKVTGLRIASHIKIDRAVSVSNRIEAALSGIIRRYEVISENYEGRFIKLRIRAFVLLKTDHPSLGPGDMSVSLTLKSPMAAWAVHEALSGAGYDVRGDGQKTDLVVTGKAHSFPLRGGRVWGFKSYRARITLKAVRRSTGEVWRISREASAVDPEPMMAARKALESAGLLAGEDLVAEMGKSLSDPMKGLSARTFHGR